LQASVLSAAIWGALAAGTLLVGAILAIRLNPSDRVTGAVMGFGAGALIGSIAYDLMPKSALGSIGEGTALAFGLGALAFFAGDWIIDRGGGTDRKGIGGGTSGGSGTAIFLGTLLDGIPESVVLGTSFALSGSGAGGVSLAFLAAIMVSNVPEGIAATRCLISEGHSQRRVLGMWIALVIAAAVSAAVGYAFASSVSSADGQLAQAFAAGAMLTMLADTMMPEAFEFGGKTVGLLTTLGFLMAAIFAVLE
jgi:ZIP family zinc transporter